MKRIPPFLFAAILICAISACKKEEPSAASPQPTPTKFELLTGNNWVLTAFTLDGDDKFKDIPLCEKDNIDKYIPNGDYLHDVGIAKCGNESQVRAIAKWEFADNETTIKRSDGFNVKIIEITNSQLIVEEKRQNGVVARYEYNTVPTFTKRIANGKFWKLTSLTNNGIDAFSKLIKCEKDNEFFFYPSGKYELHEGTETCALNAPQIMESEWVFINNETQIKIDKTLYTIKEISPTKLVLELVDENIIYTYRPK